MGPEPEKNEIGEDCMPIYQQEIAYNCVREMLWIAKVWNDHNFDHEIILKKARHLTERIDLDVTNANEFLATLQRKLSM